MRHGVVRTAYGCPVEFALALLGGKWKSVILARLKDGPLGYGEIRQLVPGVSDKVLTERLRDLEGLGLVERENPEQGRRSRYSLTARGEGLRPMLQALYDWGRVAAVDMKATIRDSS